MFCSICLYAAHSICIILILNFDVRDERVGKKRYKQKYIQRMYNNKEEINK